MGLSHRDRQQAIGRHPRVDEQPDHAGGARPRQLPVGRVAVDEPGSDRFVVGVPGHHDLVVRRFELIGDAPEHLGAPLVEGGRPGGEQDFLGHVHAQAVAHLLHLDLTRFQLLLEARDQAVVGGLLLVGVLLVLLQLHPESLGLLLDLGEAAGEIRLVGLGRALLLLQRRLLLRQRVVLLVGGVQIALQGLGSTRQGVALLLERLVLPARHAVRRQDGDGSGEQRGHHGPAGCGPNR